MAVVRRILETVGSWVVDLIAGLVEGFVDLAPMMLGLTLGSATACQSADSASPVALGVAVPKVPEMAILPHDAGAPDAPSPIGQFNVTFYYVIGEEEVVAKPAVALAKKPVANDNVPTELGSDDEALVDIVTPEMTTLFSSEGCRPIAEVSKEFASQLELQGTGKLHDGRVLNIWGACNCGHSPCFKVTENQWGTAGSGKPLQPFRTVAVDPKVVKLGSLLYVPLLAGRLMPGRSPWGGFIHDGCVVADDTGGGIDGNQLDLFVGREAYFLGISGSGGSHSWARHVEVFDGTGICERKGRQIGRKAASI